LAERKIIGVIEVENGDKMAILDKLVEKKDVLAYIDFRQKQLGNSVAGILKNTDPKAREKAVLAIRVRMKELGMMKKVVHRGIKQESIKISLEVYKYDDKGKRLEDGK
jgi:alcohol dehydrogenase YqhD (iron-dependent ADH family)